jgi:hypothetical protein
MLALSLFDEVHPFLSRDADNARRMLDRSEGHARRQMRSGVVRTLLCLAALFATVAAVGTACQPRAITPASVAG